MAKKTFFHKIMVLTNGKFAPLDDIEYTTKELKEKIKELRKYAPDLKYCIKDCGWKYTVNLSISNHKIFDYGRY